MEVNMKNKIEIIAEIAQGYEVARS